MYPESPKLVNLLRALIYAIPPKKGAQIDLFFYDLN